MVECNRVIIILHGVTMEIKVNGRNLLIVDDDAELARGLQAYFVSAGNTVTVVGNIEQAMKCLKTETFDAILLDIILPDGNGTEIFAGNLHLPPVIILSVLSNEDGMIKSFSLGAQDYVIKPCSPELLEMRIALRLLPKQMSVLSIHGLCIDSRERTLLHNGHSIRLTGSEFNILWFLMSNSQRFFTSNEIFEKVWGENSLEQTSIKFHISNLRRKLIEHTGKQLIVTKFGKGYAFIAEEKV